MHVRCPNCSHSIALSTDTEQTITDVSCPVCHGRVRLVDEEANKIPERIAQFELVSKLGEGAFGSVWLAQDTELHRQVAIKIPRKNQLSTAEAEQFLREARSAAQLTHQNIIGIHEVGRAGSLIYIVSDYVDGETLATYLARKKPSHLESVQLCAKIADALHHAHERNVIHRDLKPSNIMIDQRGEPHIMDFGIAKHTISDSSMTMEGQILGTPAYMPPEQADGDAHRVDRRADVYSLGVILYELLTGERPFQGNVRTVLYQVIHEEPPRLRKYDRSVPQDLENICLKCLQKSKRQRYETADDLAEDLRRWVLKLPIKARPLGPFARLARWSQRNPALATMMAIIVLITAAGFTGVTRAWLSEADARAAALAQKEEADRARIEAVDAQVAALKSAEEALAARAAAEKAAEEAKEQRKQAETQRRMADEQREIAEAYAAQLKQAKEDAESETRAADQARIVAENERIRANEALAQVKISQKNEKLAQEALAQAASKAYFDLSKHFADKGQYELVLANFKAAEELGVVSGDHRELVRKSLEDQVANLDDSVAIESVPLDQRRTAASVFNTYALVARNDKDFPEALKLIDRAQKFDPQAGAEKQKYNDFRKDIYVSWSNFFLAQNDYVKALEKLQASKPFADDAGKTNGLIANLYAQQANREKAADKYDEAIQLYEKAAATDPPNRGRFEEMKSDVYVLQAEQMVTEQEHAKAAELFLQAAKSSPAKEESLKSRAGAMFKYAGQLAAVGDFRKAISLYERAAEVDPTNRTDYLKSAGNLLRTQSRALAQAAEFDLAAQTYLEAAKFDPEKSAELKASAADAYQSRAKQILQEKTPPDWDQAINVHQLAIELDPDNPKQVDSLAETWRGWALQFHREKKLLEAVDGYSKAIQLRPEDAFTYLSRGNAYLSLGKFDEAIADYDRVIQLDPENVAAHRYRAEINTNYRPSQSKEVLAQAIADIEVVLKAKEDDLLQRQKIAYMLAASPTKDIRDGKRAVFHARKVCEQSGWEKPDNLVLLATAYAQAGNTAEAVKWMQQVVEKNPDNAALKEILTRYQQGQPPP